MVKKRLFLLLKIAISVLLLAYIAHKTGLATPEGRKTLWNMLRKADLTYVGWSLFIGVLQLFAGNWKWWFLLRSRDIHIPIQRVFAWYLIGRFYNLVLPTSVGGDVVRMMMVGKHTGKRADSFAAVFIERLTGLIMLVLVSLTVLVLFGDHGITIFSTSILFVSAVVFIITWTIFDTRLLNLFTGIARHFSFLDGLVRKVESAHSAVAAYRHDWATLGPVFLISGVFYLLAVFAVWTAAKAFSPDVSLEDMFLATPAIMLIMNLPVSIGGLGLMEAAYTLTFKAFGYAAALGLSVALLMRFATILYAAAGGIVQMFMPQVRKAVEAASEKASAE